MMSGILDGGGRSEATSQQIHRSGWLALFREMVLELRYQEIRGA
jgi:hypothetical protein